MMELALILFAGVLGSSHCIGMCGPFALTIGAGTTHWQANLSRQTLYTLGRVFTYSILGATAGFAGLYLQRAIPTLVNVAAVLAIVAGAFLLYQGLLAARVLRRRVPNTSGIACLASEFFGAFLRTPGRANIFLAGLFTGLMPCGLVYGFVALAASSSNMLWGAALMATFGLGTAPVMMLTGCGGGWLSLATRARLYRLAAWCVVLTGVVSIARGFGFIELSGGAAERGCPMCFTQEP